MGFFDADKLGLFTDEANLIRLEDTGFIPEHEVARGGVPRELWVVVLRGEGAAIAVEEVGFFSVRF